MACRGACPIGRPPGCWETGVGSQGKGREGEGRGKRREGHPGLRLWQLGEAGPLWRIIRRFWSGRWGWGKLRVTIFSSPLQSGGLEERFSLQGPKPASSSVGKEGEAGAGPPPNADGAPPWCQTISGLPQGEASGKWQSLALSPGLSDCRALAGRHPGCDPSQGGIPLNGPICASPALTGPFYRWGNQGSSA